MLPSAQPTSGLSVWQHAATCVQSSNGCFGIGQLQRRSRWHREPARQPRVRTLSHSRAGPHHYLALAAARSGLQGGCSRENHSHVCGKPHVHSHLKGGGAATLLHTSASGCLSPGRQVRPSGQGCRHHGGSRIAKWTPSPHPSRLRRSVTRHPLGWQKELEMTVAFLDVLLQSGVCTCPCSSDLLPRRPCGAWCLPRCIGLAGACALLAGNIPVMRGFLELAAAQPVAGLDVRDADADGAWMQHAALPCPAVAVRDALRGVGEGERLLDSGLTLCGPGLTLSAYASLHRRAGEGPHFGRGRQGGGSCSGWRGGSCMPPRDAVLRPRRRIHRRPPSAEQPSAPAVAAPAGAAGRQGGPLAQAGAAR
jgi:hypothetical protein